MDFLSKLDPIGQKKILSLDGGGIRGILTIEILAKIESDLRKKLNNEQLILSDYFDFVAGTSTGAIIATCISLGMSIDEIRDFYVESGDDMFNRKSVVGKVLYKINITPKWLKGMAQGLYGFAYDDKKLTKKLKAVIGEDITLESDKLKTILLIVMRNATTDSPWPVTNNPFAKYNQTDRKDCNLNLPLWQLVRASTAAPTYFPPEVVTFAKGEPEEYTFIFVDGGVTTYNNPAFLAFQMATAKPYNINWNTGVDDLLIVSVGTGNAPKTWHNLETDEMSLIHHAKNIPSALMNAASAGWDMACRTVGHCRFGLQIDREYGDMVISKGGDSNWTGEELFSYVRYDPDVTKKGLEELGLEHIKPKSIQELDAINSMKEIQKVGKSYAEKYVNLSHLGSFV